MCLKTKKPQVKASFEKMMRRPLPTPTPKEMPASILEAWQKGVQQGKLVGYSEGLADGTRLGMDEMTEAYGRSLYATSALA